MIDIFTLLIDHGWWVAVTGVLLAGCCSFIIRDQYRLQVLERRIQALEQEDRKNSLQMLSRCESALGRVADVMIQNQKILEKLLLER